MLGIALDVFPRDLSIFLLNSKISGMKLSCFDQNKDWGTHFNPRSWYTCLFSFSYSGISWYLLNLSFHLFPTLILVCITYLLNDDGQQHLCVLLLYKWRQTIVYLFTINLSQVKHGLYHQEKIRVEGIFWKSGKISESLFCDQQNFVFFRPSKGMIWMICQMTSDTLIY